MALNLVLVAQRQTARGMALTWGETEGVQGFEVFVATKRLSPEELEAAEALGGTEDCLVAKVGPEVKSVVDDVTPAGEPRFYAVAMVFADGVVKPARFCALPDGATGQSATLSAAKGAAAGKSAPRPAAPATVARERVSARETAPAPGSVPQEDPLEARKRAQREARARATAEAPTRTPSLAGVERPQQPDRSPLPERPQPTAAAPPQQPAAIPLAEDLELRMTGADQTWDGLRVYWDRDPRAAAVEIVVSDHPIALDEVRDVLAGRADFTYAAAVAPSVTAVIDNVTAREARSWYAVLARSADGKRKPHPFQVGDAAASGRTSAPFLNPNRTGEVRAEAEGMVEEARAQWTRWKAEQDGGARREAKRLVQEALLVFPGLPSATALAGEMG